MYSYYTYTLNTIYFTAFYLPAVPIGLIFSIIGLIQTYCIIKYLFLRRFCIPKKLGMSLGHSITKMMELVPIIYGSSNLVFDGIIKRDTGSRAVPKLLILVGVVYQLLPMNWLNRKIFKTARS